MTAKTMAEVLAEHQDWTYKRNLGYYRSEYLCRCGERFWHGDHAEDPTFNEAVAAHHAAALSAAGFGLVADAKAEALEEAADKIMGPSDVPLDGATCRWNAMELREKAANLRDPS